MKIAEILKEQGPVAPIKPIGSAIGAGTVKRKTPIVAQNPKIQQPATNIDNQNTAGNIAPVGTTPPASAGSIGDPPSPSTDNEFVQELPQEKPAKQPKVVKPPIQNKRTV